MAETREVWSHNLEHEFNLISVLVASQRCTYIAMDAEFPGFIFQTPFRASEEQRYEDMRRNVEMMKVIQLGLTFYDEGGQRSPGLSWQFNFREFDPAQDPHVESSIELLRDSGMDFDRNQRDGVDGSAFTFLFWQRLIMPCYGKIKWVTFHGLYDLGYLIRLVTGLALPNTLPGFLSLVHKTLGRVYDVKHIAKLYGLGERIGLVKMAEVLGVDRQGQKHQAGYDSMITGLVFWRIKESFGLDEDIYSGVLYGLEKWGSEHARRCKAQAVCYARARMVAPRNFEQCDPAMRGHVPVPYGAAWMVAPPGCFAPAGCFPRVALHSPVPGYGLIQVAFS